MSARARADVDLATRVTAIHAAHRGRYGAPRIHAQMSRDGVRTSRKRVARLMKERGLRAHRPRRYRSTTDSNHALPVAKNVLGRRFDTTRPNEVWVGDITYLETGEGWLYVAVLLDLFSRKVVGWAASERIDTNLCSTALKRAIRGEHPPAGILHHSDQGSQYASHEYQALLKQHRIRCSMSRRANCWDNAVAESFFATMKKELGDERPRTRAGGLALLVVFIEGYYNRQRLHSSIGFRTPAEAMAKAGRVK
jgi:transposase InsO family protein